MQYPSKHAVTPHQICLTEAVLMRGHNIIFGGVLTCINKLSLDKSPNLKLFMLSHAI